MLLGFMSKYRILDKIMGKECPVIKPGEMNISSPTKQS